MLSSNTLAETNMSNYGGLEIENDGVLGSCMLDFHASLGQVTSIKLGLTTDVRDY